MKSSFLKHTLTSPAFVLKIVLFQVLFQLLAGFTQTSAQVVTDVKSGASTIDLTVNSNQTGTLYYVLYNAVPGSPTAANVKADATAAIAGSIIRNGTVIVGATETSTNLFRLLTNLTDNKTYYLYVVFENSSGGLGAVQNFTRVLPIRQPALSYVATASSISGKTINYLLYKPEPYYKNPAKSYSLLLFFHGDGEKAPASMENLKRNGPPKVINENGELDFIVASPQSQGVGVVDWLSPGFLNEFIEKMKADNRVSIDKIYVTALSGGGGGLYYLSATQPSKIAAIMPVCGVNSFWSFGTDQYYNIKDIPLWGFHNQYDNTVTVSNLNAVVNGVNACNPPPIVTPKTTIYNAYGHDAWTQTYSNPTIYPWLLGKTKPDPLNTQPTVSAGTNVNLTLPTNSLNLTGTASDPDGSIASYEWRKMSGPDATVGVANTNSLKVKDLKAGTYIFRLTVTDNKNSINYSDVTVTILANQPPNVNSGGNKLVNLPAFSVNLNGSATDADGTIASYLWTQQSGSALTLSNANTATLTVANLVAGTYIFRLTATDNQGLSAFSEMTLTINSPPVVNAGGNKTITLPTNNTTLTGSATDANGTIQTYAWTQQSGPNTATIGGAGTAILSTSGLIQGTYVFRLTVTDNLGATGFSDATVIVNPAPVNIPPVVSAGGNKTITLPINSTILNGSGTDSDGTVQAYAWTQQSGPVGGTLSGINTAILSLSNLIAGTYVFRLTVTDNLGATGFSDATVIVNPAPVNIPPVVSAGIDQTITLPINSATFTSTATDSDGTIASIAWTQSSGTNSATLTGNTTNALSATNLIAGTYIFRFTATDNTGSSVFDDVSIVVNPEPINIAPVANAGGNQSITLPTNAIILNGIGTDADGTVAAFAWSQTAGSAASFTGQNTQNLTLSNLIAGTYKFNLTVTDNKGATSSNEMTLIVNPEPVNLPPNVTVSANQNITLPINTATFTSTATDADGTIASILWTQSSGPNSATLAGNTTNALSATNLIAGTYIFRFTATDNKNATGFAEVTLIVNPEPVNLPPTVTVSANQNITLPTNSATFTSTATDADGTIASILWTQSSGPNSATLTGNTTNALSAINLIAGTYIFRFTATDNKNATAYAEVTLTVNPEPINIAPVANAGGNQSITLPTNAIILNGIGTDADGTVAAFAWSQTAGSAASFTGQNTQNLTLSNLIAGTYKFNLTVTDNKGATSSNEMTLIVNPEPVNLPPIANAGADKTLVSPENQTSLTGTAFDSDGTIASYLWTQQSGPNTATLSGQNTAILSATGLIEGTYIFRLTVTDNQGGTGLDEASVFVVPPVVNQPPVVSAGSNKTLTLPTNTIIFNGTATDSDGTIQSVLWTRESGGTATLAGENTNDLTLTNLVAGLYVFRLTATDNLGDTAFDEVTLTVNPEPINIAPVANAGGNQSITLPTNAIILNGIGTDADGTVSAFAWSQTAGSAASFTGQNTQNLTLSNLIAGTYKFNLTVTDNKGATSSNEMTLIVNPEPVNLPPNVTVSANQNITLPINTATFTSTATDADGTIASILWTQSSGPNSATLAGNTTNALSATNLIAGTYIFRFTATDNKNATGFAEVTLIVNPEPVNLPPTVTVSANQNITLPTNSATFTSTATDADGTIASILWTQSSGPNSATLTGNTTNALSAINLIAGTYIFRFTATDNKNATAYAEVTLTVNPEPINIAPVANAGGNQSITLPTNAIILNGIGTDADGTVAAFAWSQTAGSAASFTGQNTQNLTLSNLIAGTYKFNLTVTDNKGATSSNEMTLIVNPEPVNLPPNVTVSANQNITLPINTATFTSTATDADGTIASILWTQSSGPNSATLAGNTTNALSATNLIAGTYIFRFTATDNKNATGFAEVTLIVNPEPVNLPPTVTVSANQNITLPTNSATFTSTATDADGTIASILWTQSSGPNSATLTGNTTNSLTTTNLIAGTYVFRFTATDDKGLASFSNVSVSVSITPLNLPPVADAGGNKTLTLPTNSISLNATASDPDDGVQSVLWTRESGGTATVAGENTNSLTLTNLVAGTYTFRFTVTDTKGSTGFDEMTLTVISPVVNQPPTVSAGTEQTLTLPINSLQLFGAASDPDGSISNYNWTKQSGGNATLTNAETSVLTVSSLESGTYIFRLTVTDDQGANAFSEVKVTVNSNPQNYMPVASAGNDTTLVLPVGGGFTLTGSAADNDGQVVFYEWTNETALPANLFNANSPVLNITNLEAGTYIFRLTVTDNNGGQNFDEVQVTILSQIPVTDLRAKRTFSPNSDTIDDVWEIEKISRFPSYRVLIINEKGKLIYTSNSHIDDKVWDGKINGTEVPEGAYYFVVKNEDKDVMAGSFLLIR